MTFSGRLIFVFHKIIVKVQYRSSKEYVKKI